MQIAGTVLFVALDECGTSLLLTNWGKMKAVNQGGKIQAGASGDDREMAAIRDLAHGGAGLSAIFAGGHGVVGIGDVDEMVGDLALFFRGGLGGANVHAAVDGYGVAADDFSVEALGEG